MVFQGQSVDERLGYRLDREGLHRVPALEDFATGRDDHDTKPGRIRLAELRDVIGNLALVKGSVLLVDVFLYSA